MLFIIYLYSNNISQPCPYPFLTKHIRQAGKGDIPPLTPNYGAIIIIQETRDVRDKEIEKQLSGAS